ncbi:MULTISPECIES: DUF642 domain-containing protein [Corallococcus]|uniref:DUF642 domain-containing protein n=1 Tax=Corallococcus TaxID=83461 RepID=UPI001376DCB6|nr:MULTISPECIES: DUF642 domain-containing protein [Corallococcus]NBD08969.1 DUF642 domain-containing protein [Corallococcus silvisoli]
MKGILRGKSLVGLGLGLALAGCGPETDAELAREPGTGTVAQPLTELVTNGGFESSPLGFSNWVSLFAGNTQLTGWTILGSGIDVMASSYRSANAGSASIDLNAYDAGGVSQTLTTASGTGYTVRFALAGCVGTYVKVTAGSVAYNFRVNYAGWVSNNFVFNATSSSTELKFESLSTGVSCGPQLDSVSVTGP